MKNVDFDCPQCPVIVNLYKWDITLSGFEYVEHIVSVFFVEYEEQDWKVESPQEDDCYQFAQNNVDIYYYYIYKNAYAFSPWYDKTVESLNKTLTLEQILQENQKKFIVEVIQSTLKYIKNEYKIVDGFIINKKCCW